MVLGVEERAEIDRKVAASRSQIRAAPYARSRAGLRIDCPELACLRGWLSERTIEAAHRRASKIGTGADRVLIGAGLLDEDIYLRLLSESLGISFEPLDLAPRESCPLDDARLISTPTAGLLPITVDGELKLIVAPRDNSARRLIEVIHSRPELAKVFRLTTAARLQAFVSRHAEAAIGQRATRHLAETHRDMSAAPPRRRPSLAHLSMVCATGLLALVAAPSAIKLACDAFLTTLFLAWIVLRMVGVLLGPTRTRRRVRLAEQALPIYTIMAPLYREARSVPGLIAALRALDYPGFMAQTPQAV